MSRMVVLQEDMFTMDIHMEEDMKVRVGLCQFKEESLLWQLPLATSPPKEADQDRIAIALQQLVATAYILNVM